jgi:beta-lactamase regulating signal transducer with metallopeptidase domain
MSSLFSSAIQAAIILFIGLCALGVLRSRSAALRHCVLATAVVFAALAPLFYLVTPAWNIGPAAAELPAVAPIREHISVMFTGRVVSAAIAATPARPAESPELLRQLPWVFWSAGALAGLAVLVTGLARVVRIALASKPVSDGQWTRLAGLISREYGLRRPVALLESRNPSILVTFGGLRPKIILPAGASEWPEARARIVLRHELAHVRRGDWMVQMIAQTVRAVYWFNPLVWVVCRRLRLESECACDDAVLARDIDGAEYAGHLLELARALNLRGHSWSAALSMARLSTIERRFSAMLNPAANRQPVSRSTRYCSALAGFCVALSLSVVNSSAAPGGSPAVPLPAAVESVQAPASPPPVKAEPPARPPTRPVQAEPPSRPANPIQAEPPATPAKPVEDDPLAFALVAAAGEGHVEVVSLLLERGANPNTPIVWTGGTALMVAASEGHVEVVRLLLERGGDPVLSIPPLGSALSIAASEGHVDVVRLLLEKVPPRPAK